MPEAHLDHPGEIAWFAGYGPIPRGGPCSHDCDHAFTGGVIAWGPDYDHYTLHECRECRCRAWASEYPPPFTADRPKYRERVWLEVKEVQR